MPKKNSSSPPRTSPRKTKQDPIVIEPTLTLQQLFEKSDERKISIFEIALQGVNITQQSTSEFKKPKLHKNIRRIMDSYNELLAKEGLLSTYAEFEQGATTEHFKDKEVYNKLSAIKTYRQYERLAGFLYDLYPLAFKENLTAEDQTKIKNICFTLNSPPTNIQLSETDLSSLITGIEFAVTKLQLSLGHQYIARSGLHKPKSNNTDSDTLKQEEKEFAETVSNPPYSNLIDSPKFNSTKRTTLSALNAKIKPTNSSPNPSTKELVSPPSEPTAKQSNKDPVQTAVFSGNGGASLPPSAPPPDEAEENNTAKVTNSTVAENINPPPGPVNPTVADTHNNPNLPPPPPLIKKPDNAESFPGNQHDENASTDNAVKSETNPNKQDEPGNGTTSTTIEKGPSPEAEATKTDELVSTPPENSQTNHGPFTVNDGDENASTDNAVKSETNPNKQDEPGSDTPLPTKEEKGLLPPPPPPEATKTDELVATAPEKKNTENPSSGDNTKGEPLTVTVVEANPAHPSPLPTSPTQNSSNNTNGNAETVEPQSFFKYLKDEATNNRGVKHKPPNNPTDEHFFRCDDGTVFGIHPNNDTVRITYDPPANAQITDIKDNPQLTEYFKKFDEPTLNVNFEVKNNADLIKLKNFITIATLSAEACGKKLHLNFGDIKVDNNVDNSETLQQKVVEFITKKTVEKVKSDTTNTATNTAAPTPNPPEQRYTSVTPPTQMQGLVNSSLAKLREEQRVQAKMTNGPNPTP